MGAAGDAETASRGQQEAGRRALTSVGSRSTRTRARPGYRRGRGDLRAPTPPPLHSSRFRPPPPRGRGRGDTRIVSTRPFRIPIPCEERLDRPRLLLRSKSSPPASAADTAPGGGMMGAAPSGPGGSWLASRLGGGSTAWRLPRKDSGSAMPSPPAQKPPQRPSRGAENVGYENRTQRPERSTPCERASSPADGSRFRT